jgi:hypothetical protein
VDIADANVISRAALDFRTLGHWHQFTDRLDLPVDNRDVQFIPTLSEDQHGIPSEYHHFAC